MSFYTFDTLRQLDDDGTLQEFVISLNKQGVKASMLLTAQVVYEEPTGEATADDPDIKIYVAPST